jgi:ABC-type amino acid transport substrate-binding protein
MPAEILRVSFSTPVKLLAAEGHVTVALVIERMPRGAWSPDIIQAALDQLKASGDYQRIIDDVAR